MGDRNEGGDSVYTHEQEVRLRGLRDAAAALADVFDADSPWGAAGPVIAARVSRSLSTEEQAPLPPRQPADLTATP